jgi:hypothetical protein
LCVLGAFLTCAGCATHFSAQQLKKHLHENDACAEAEAKSILGLSKPKLIRNRRTVDFKCNMLAQLNILKARGVPHAQTQLVRLYPGLKKQVLSSWVQVAQSLFEAQGLGYGQKRYIVKIKRAWYSKEEDELYVRFIYEREIRGLTVDEWWLQDEMLDILEEIKPEGWQDFKCSAGWLQGFKTRYKISEQMRNNKKHLPIIERLPVIRAFHQWLLQTLQASDPQRCPKYGRFSAAVIFHMVNVFFPKTRKTDNEGYGAGCCVGCCLGSNPSSIRT